MFRTLAAALLAGLISLPAFGQVSEVDGTIRFDPPEVGGVVDGYRYYIDGELAGPVEDGHQVSRPAGSTFRLGVEAYNDEGTSLVEAEVTVDNFAPGPIRNLRFECDGKCSTVIQFTE